MEANKEEGKKKSILIARVQKYSLALIPLED